MLSTRATRSSGTSAIGSTRPQHAEQLAEHVQGAHGVAVVHLGEPGQHQVADRVAGQHAGAAEAVLQERRQLLRALLRAGQGGQRHAQVAGRQDRHLAADPAGGAAVVGDGDHGGELAA